MVHYFVILWDKKNPLRSGGTAAVSTIKNPPRFSIFHVSFGPRAVNLLSKFFQLRETRQDRRGVYKF